MHPGKEYFATVTLTGKGSPVKDLKVSTAMQHDASPYQYASTLRTIMFDSFWKSCAFLPLAKDEFRITIQIESALIRKVHTTPFLIGPFAMLLAPP
ncbi:unnamed protein product [Haemonchus placei]|uniref:Fibronectin type-III domain-containing protein n=1 Tax=Haemonchus placei TaxID=6290 RepID=A0A0N4WKK4_HAEPC|nr:unnamed protein product [Haemonchus placei]